MLCPIENVRMPKDNQWLKRVLHLFVVILLVGCGAWAGNPGDGDEEDNKQGPGDPVPIDPQPNVLRLAQGDVLIQDVSLAEGAVLNAQMIFSPVTSLWSSNADSTVIEVSLLDEKGQEVAYKRKGTDETVLNYTATAQGMYKIVVKSNTADSIDLSENAITGADSAGTIEKANERNSALYADRVLKGLVVLARECRELDSQGNIAIVAASDGRYFVQPIIFYGKVRSDKSVEPLYTATMSIRAGNDVIELVKLKDLPRSTFREFPALNDDEERAYVRQFYNGYFGAPGELYTVETFRKGGDCHKAATIALTGDVGANTITLDFADSEAAITLSVDLRATVAPSFSTYEANDKRISDWTQCTYNRLTAEPTTYNGDATACKTFRYSDPPYVKLDYLLPSESSDGIAQGLTKASDPTRLLYYGHSYPKQWYQKLIADDILASGASQDVILDTCLSNGGLVAVPLDTQKTFLPLKEFNASENDIINLARRAGSYTALVNFFQGNVQSGGQYKVPACLPKDGQTCYAFRLLNVTTRSCSIKADSGISVSAISDSYVYPDFFEMSGIILP